MSTLIKYFICVLMLSIFALQTPAIAANSNPPKRGKISGKTVAGGLLSLIIWPGIGQAINDNEGDKVVTHVIGGLIPPFRIWSCYDALVDRSGGYWDGRI